MKTSQAPKGPWINRFAIRALTVFLAALIFWFLGFLVQDIESIKGPNYDEVEKRHVDAELVEQRDVVKKDVQEAERQLTKKKEEQRLVGESSKNLQRTIDQLIGLQKSSIENNQALPEAQQDTLAGSMTQFLQSQKEYQEINAQLSQLTSDKHALEDRQQTLDRKIDAQREPAREEFKSLRQRHDFKLGMFQLAILVPLLLLATFLVLRKRGSIYFPLFIAFGGATLLKVVLVLHEYFPTRYFKYILIGALLIAVARILVFFIRVVAFPKAQWLIRQYREAYERFLCPVCEFPIRTGPRKYLFWTRRTVGKVAIDTANSGDEAAYTCPCCSSPLFENCSACGKQRHSLLPTCCHCGATREVSDSETR